MNVSHRIGAASPLRGRVWPCLGDLAGSAEVTVAGSFDAQDRMLSYGTCQYEYTRNGELTRRTDSASGAVTNYQYDEFGNLRGVDLPDGRVVSYHIDGLNRRVGKSIDGVRQWGLLYANQLEPVAELDGAGNIVASFLYADRPHVPSLMLKGGHTYRILSDHLGSVRLVIDINDGSIAQRLAYDEYGNVIEDTHPGFQPFAYAGGLYDPDTGLTRFGARDYDAVAGRWTAKDPVRFSAGMNIFEYCAGDPLNLFDPTGLEGVGVWNSRALLEMWGVRHANALNTMMSDFNDRRLWGHENFPGEVNSSMRHCSSSCVLGYQYDTGIARAAGLINELQGLVRWDIPNLADRLNGNSQWACQTSDLRDNERGFDAAENSSPGLSTPEVEMSCKLQCGSAP
jgi:RHS repeat-associated protein